MTDTHAPMGPNAWLVDEMYDRWLANPELVPASWRQLFEDDGHGGEAEGAEAAAPPAELTPPAPSPAPVASEAGPTAAATPTPPAATSDAPPAAARPAPAASDSAAPSPERGEPLRGAAARIVANMEASLAVPTATSYRQVPARLLEVNRKVINGYLGRTRGGKVSFTHLIAYALVKAVGEVPAMRTTFTAGSDGKPRVVRHDHIGLGLAVDVERADGTRSLLVPVIRDADTLEFRSFHAAYEELIAKVQGNRISPDDFAGATLSLTNVGTLGTVQSVPRLMQGQSAIVGVGALGYPAEFEGADPEKLAELGVSKVMTVSNTYDHRIVQGAESGMFLRRVHDLLLGGDDFYEEVFQSLGVPYAAVRWHRDTNPADDDGGGRLFKQTQVRKLVQMYRVRGHLIADLDPLALHPRGMHPELDPATYGLTIWDLDRQFLTDDVAGPPRLALGDILGVLRDAYCRTIGVEYMHMQEPAERAWIQEMVESAKQPYEADEQRHILDRLRAATIFEQFLHRRYVGHKRFGLEGAESAIVVLDTILEAAADGGLAGAVLGMAHRGRLNVLTNIVGQSYDQLFRQFEGVVPPDTMQGTGDVKYHLGAQTKFRSRAGNELPVELAANPSHLEAVDPVVIGVVRARQDVTGTPGSFPVLPVLIHGDAAFAGQGVVAETLNTSQLPGYRVGGTVHLVINNQVGYTTSVGDARSSPYPTDVAKGVQVPIFHVNGDDPEACVRATRWAVAYRARFHKDVVIDMFCYRRHGHNEGDDPSYTQPRMYEAIEHHEPVFDRYRNLLVERGDLSLDEAKALDAAFEATLQEVLDATRSAARPTTSLRPQRYVADFTPVRTGVDRATLDRVHDALYAWPESFSVHPKLLRQFETRRSMYEAGEVDWGLAEALAYGSLLLDGRSVRLTGQDTRRGTFAHRHAALIDYHTEDVFVPLWHLADDQGQFWVYDSSLSEYAAMGIEYGYATVARDDLVAWEAQFGDFVNGAQIIIDQFLAAGDDKWAQRSGLVLLLPHGLEGQGPEHSSARIERFLTLSAEGNMTVADVTTSAQFFHLLRRQVAQGNQRPLVVFTPKSLLRAKQARSPVEELSSSSFREVLDDETVDPASVEAIVLCTGKVAFDAIAARDREGFPGAVVRVEQIYPWPGPILAGVRARYPAAKRLVWLQEEPLNMGAGLFVKARADLPDLPLTIVARPESGSPATGMLAVHQQELDTLMAELAAACRG